MPRYTIEQLKQMRESEDHVEFKKVNTGTCPTTVQEKINLRNVAGVSLDMLPHFVMKEAVGLLSVCTMPSHIK